MLAESRTNSCFTVAFHAASAHGTDELINNLSTHVSDSSTSSTDWDQHWTSSYTNTCSEISPLTPVSPTTERPGRICEERLGPLIGRQKGAFEGSSIMWSRSRGEQAALSGRRRAARARTRTRLRSDRASVRSCWCHTHTHTHTRFSSEEEQ